VNSEINWIHKMMESSCVAEQLLASHEGLSSINLGPTLHSSSGI
jgi:hypothetical protein